jgi:fibro-slime domain-containing protein
MRIAPRSLLSTGGLGFLLVLTACGSNGAQLVTAPADSDAGGQGGQAGAGGSGTSQIHIDTPDASMSMMTSDDASSSSDAPGIGLCGDGQIGPGESCDDGNAVPGDGCSGVCTIEPGYKCDVPGKACVYTVTMVCGNGMIEGTEACDDGNTVSGDGCSSTCDVEQGFACATAGQPCTPVATAKCGDGVVNAGEECDDGNTASSDGCSSTCKLEMGWTCPNPGKACVKFEYCGDGIVQASRNEQCDDGNTVPGDGCSGICQIEPGYSCADGGVACMKIWVCGNAKVDPGEACDDGNTVGGDGCSADCTTVEQGYTCPKGADLSGGPCAAVPPNTCGDAIVGPAEQCDDGNKVSNDGCSATCALEPGYTCPTPGMACTRIAYCGDGVLNLDLGEQCDDHNTTAGDGCNALCQVELNFTCPTPGQPCVSTVVCGDGVISGNEQCDDHNTAPGDGCSATCQLEAGWLCPVPGAKCTAKACGDGIIAGNEQCDDQNTTPNDGCSPTCRLEPGFACTVVNGKSVCHATVCGDGTLEGFEQCDDHNLIPYDGCSPTCTIEPKCAGGQCTPVCGDGLKFPQEECDDGNTTSGDGCSANCKLETGFDCNVVTLSPPSQLVIPILYRDFRYANTSIANPKPDGGVGDGGSVDAGFVAFGHPDFQIDPYNGATGLVKSTLGTDGKPEYLSSKGSGPNTLIQDATSFYWWYHDQQCGADGGACNANPYDKLVYLDGMGKPTTLTLGNISGDTGPAVYQYNNDTFFPIDNLGFNATPATNQVSNGHNFSFTSELRYQFTYAGGEKLDFTGDDDVWVFINGHLAVDIGGIHGATSQSITLDATQATNLGLTVGGMYEIALFQAERHTTESHYKLTLSGFTHAITQCTPHCGDGKVVGDEVCDDGKNDGSYGSCMPGCKARAGYCGDNTVQTPYETCDDGTNLATYGGTAKVCGPGCKWAPYCGDGVTSNGEGCDEGALNGTGYPHCTAACKIGIHCGDGVINGPEQCDDGINNGASADKCSATCTLNCGNGVIDPGEQCDDGANNGAGYGKCTTSCTLGPRCGDGIKNGPEQCDDGKNDGSYGTCKPDCTLADYCGDGKVTSPPETCDQGAQNSASAYGKNLCNLACKPAPYCGDKAVDGNFGEVCDDGVNSGQPGSCTPDCKGFVPLASCGDGTVQPPEQCDDGAAKNGTAQSTCDTHCKKKCGNGIKDPGEQCDNGVNDGSYGTCTSSCTFAGYCGDGVKSGPEQCDNGASNQPLATAYGQAICTSVCVWAPFCGDGRVQAQFGEQCDGDPNCDANCKISMVH